MTRTIEDIILDHDRRGINALRPHVPADFCAQAARYALVHSGPVIIATGFYIMMSDAPETDGPPGAFAIGNALRELGNPVMYTADEPMAYMMASWRARHRDPSPIIRFPIIDDPNINEHFVQETITERDPALLISIERCSRDADGIYRNMRGRDITPQTARVDRLFECGLPSIGIYRNMRGRDITPQTARVDRLFECGLPSIGIGDGGNEIGMGNLAEVVAQADQLPDHPAVVGCDRLIISSTSNWGGYGLVAALSLEVGRNLLPDVDTDADCIRFLVDSGAVSGVSGEHDYLVDEFTLEENAAVLNELHELVNDQLSNRT